MKNGCFIMIFDTIFVAIFLQFAPFDPNRKKKKKKPVVQDTTEEMDKLAEKTDDLSGLFADEKWFLVCSCKTSALLKFLNLGD